MNAFINGTTTTLHDESTIALFIEQLINGNKIMNCFHIERLARERASYYKPEMITSTVKRLLQEYNPCSYKYYPKKVFNQLKTKGILQQEETNQEQTEETYEPPTVPELHKVSFKNYVIILAINAIYSDLNLHKSLQYIICKIVEDDKEKCKHLFNDFPRLNHSEEAKQMDIDLCAFFNKVPKQQKTL